MVNTGLFRTRRNTVPSADARNQAGGAAYRLDARAALAQLAVTGCLNSTFYASDTNQLDAVLQLAHSVEPSFVAKVAVWARQRGYMKDMPALLCAVLASRDLALLRAIFPRVIDNSKMLRNFVQVIRSGRTGRKSLGRGPKRLVAEWIERRSDKQLLNDSVGNQPSLADVIRLAHPSPGDSVHRKALFAWLLGREHDADVLPEIVRHFERFKRGESDAPDVNFQLLTGLPLGTEQWTDIARRATWQQLRINLNTLARHGVFEVPGMTELVAAVLRDPQEVAGARVFPYQLLVAAMMAGDGVPHEVRESLVLAMELSTANVPEWGGRVAVCPDVSGSMQSPVTGYRKGATSKVRCVDVAALISSVVLRRNPQTQILAFDTSVHKPRFRANLPVLEAAKRLAKFGGGGTSCSAPLADLNKRKAMVDVVVIVSDNMSWADTSTRGTATMTQWATLKKRCPQAKMVCIDIQPYTTVQAPPSNDVLHVGGFSDMVFDVIRSFMEQSTADHCVQQIEALSLEPLPDEAA